MNAATSIADNGIVAAARRAPVLAVGLLLTVLPTLYSMATQSWTREEGVHGPLVLAVAGWLIWRSWDELSSLARPGKLWLAVPVVILSMLAYVFGRAFNFLLIEVGGLLLGLVAIAYAYVGHRVLLKMWFPILFLVFVIPLPGWLLDTMTQPLKILVSDGFFRRPAIPSPRSASPCTSPSISCWWKMLAPGSIPSSA
jgi:hypothetical protein